MDFRLLGPFEIDDSNGSQVNVGGQKRRGLLALLIAHAGETQSRDRLVDALWTDGLTAADNTVQTYVSQLRKLLEGEVRIETVGRGYRFVAPRTCVDITRFLDDASSATVETRAAERRLALAEALAIWRGPALEEFAGSPWADVVAQRLEQRRLEVLELRIEADLALGRAREMVGELAELVRAYPLAEPLWAQRMIALFRCGHQADALRAYGELRAILAEELGIEPSRALADLELRILDQDESLLVAGLEAEPRPARSDAPELPVGTVTFLLTDIVSSTELWDTDRDAMSRAVREHESIIESVLADSSGYLLKHRGEGDSTLSVFDRAADALAAAVALRDRFNNERDALSLPIAIRIALHTGEVEARDSDYFGPTLNRAARIRALAAGGEILCSRATAEIVADVLPPAIALIELGSVRLRGLQRNEVVYRVVATTDAAVPQDVVPGGDAEYPSIPEARFAVDLADESSLIARETEMDRLTALFAGVVRGQAAVVFVRGDAGVGKSRLLHEFVEGCGTDAAFHSITCSPRGASARVALADIVRRSSAERPDAADSDVVTLLAEGEAGADSDLERLRLLTSLRDAIRDLARDGPAVLVVEDIHWAEPGFVDLLEFLVQDLLNRREETRLLLVLTRRTFAVPHDVEAVLARLERLARAQTMTLRPLREMDIDELVRAYRVDPPGRMLVHLLYERSRGNPLYVREALRRIADLDGFVVRGGRIETTVPPTEFGAPADLRELVARRLADLPQNVLDVLALASIAGFEFDPELVDRIGFGDTGAHLATAARAGLVSETAGGYRFTHPIIHAAVYDDIPPEQRRMHHRTLAASIDRLPADQRDRRLLEFANHVLEGGVADTPGYVADDLVEAGRRAAALAEWREAARCYDGAIAIATRAGADQQSIGWMQFWSGVTHERHYDAPAAEERYWSALEIGRTQENVELLGRAALALAMHTSVAHPNAALGNYDERAWQALVDALDKVGTELPTLRAELLCNYAEMQYQRLQIADGLEAASQAVRLAADAGNAELQVVCESNLAYGHLSAGDAAAAVAVLTDARGRIDSELNPQDQGFALARLSLGYLALGRLEEALRTSHDAFAVFEAGRHQSGACLAETIIADILLRTGERREGERHATDAARLYRISEYSQVPPVLYAALVAARSAAGDFESARQAVAEWRATGQRGDGLAAALLDVRAGTISDPDALAERARRWMALASAPSIVQVGWLGALAEIADSLQLVDLARDVSTAIETRVTADVVFSPGLPFHALATRAVALRAMHSPEAEAECETALGALAAVGAGPEFDRLSARRADVERGR